MAAIIGNLAFCMVLFALNMQSIRVGVTSTGGGAPRFKMYSVANGNSSVEVKHFTATPVWIYDEKEPEEKFLRFCLSFKLGSQTYYLSRVPSQETVTTATAGVGVGVGFTNESIDAVMLHVTNFDRGQVKAEEVVDLGVQFFLDSPHQPETTSFLHYKIGAGLRLLPSGAKPNGYRLLQGNVLKQ